MAEAELAEMLESEGVDLIASLPCDRSKAFTSLLHREFDVVDLTREEDGVGVCAGASLGGRRPAMSIQSSGLGNMMNAIMSLTSLYGLPLPIIASWRGVDGDPIEAQGMFNPRIPQMLDAFGIRYGIVGPDGDIGPAREMVRAAFREGIPTVTLVRPGFWGRGDWGEDRPARSRSVSIRIDKRILPPTMARIDAIRAVMGAIGDGDAVVSNIGVPSKEACAVRDRGLNFYMLGSYGQASSIGLGVAMSTDRRVVVLDGDGGVLGTSILPVIASVRPGNLTIACLDNGTFGSTGDQTTPAYLVSDTEAVARAHGISRTCSTSDADGLAGAVRAASRDRGGPSFIQALIRPSNSDSPDIAMPAREIGGRFRDSL